MDVINLSLGEPEIEPTRDLVVAAINAAADAGVVPAIAAGNEFETSAAAPSPRRGAPEGDHRRRVTSRTVVDGSRRSRAPARRRSRCR